MSAGARRNMEESRRERRVDGHSQPKRGPARGARGRAAGVALVVKKARPTARTRRPSRPFRGHVDVEPPTAIGETARRRGGEDEEADGEDAPPLAAAPGAGRCRAPERYRRDGATPRRRR